ncbi:hypothetical protein GCM10009665_49220 [Kitasatospora nipponensis]|uniref:Uncharacterized protein n=1 Tax=Kitasatospora nipponensis TaxID=258049 RepID=A0ABN1WJR6_9ACTN
MIRPLTGNRTSVTGGRGKDVVPMTWWPVAAHLSPSPNHPDRHGVRRRPTIFDDHGRPVARLWPPLATALPIRAIRALIGMTAEPVGSTDPIAPTALRCAQGSKRQRVAP